MNPDECYYLHEGHCIIEAEYPDFVCKFRYKETPDDILWLCNATPDDLMTEDEYHDSLNGTKMGVEE